MNIDSLIRPNIRKLKPYSPARSLYQSGTFFDANENAFGSTVGLPGYYELNRYPDPSSSELRGALARFVGMSAKNIFTGNGSDEVIDLLIRIFAGPGEKVAIVEPTYGMYRVAADTAGIEAISLPLDKEFQLNVVEVLKNVSSKVKIVFLCSPNNPTGNLLRTADIERMCEGFDGIVVVDEAYIEFASAPSLARKVSRSKNLVVMRTLSKAWGLAGIRIGYVVASEEIITYLDKVKPPYNVNRISSALAVRALQNESEMETMRKSAINERARLTKELSALGFTVFPSEGNFLLVKYPGISKVAKSLAVQDGIIVRDFGNTPMLEDCIRITVGTREQNLLLFETLKKRL